ncbi:hypothetical protein PINS_up001200 [Pythium insidiosum]|nr:hypothetical protein PINS_up001200 [Pythium insidiosum]
MSSSADRDSIDFDRAKNFWQSLGRRSSSFRESFTGSSSSSATTAAPQSASSNADAATTTSPSPPPSRLTIDPKAAPVVSVPQEPTTPPAAPPSPLHSSMESPSQGSLQFPSAESAKTAMNNMLKAFQDTKLFPSGTHEGTEDSGSTSRTASWKDKMRSYSVGRSNSSKASFSFDRLSAQLKTTLNNVSLTSEAERNAHIAAMKSNVHRPQRRTTTRSPVVSPSSVSDKEEADEGTDSVFGELIVVEVLAGRELAVGDFFQGESDPYVVVRLREWERKTVVVKDTKNPVYNERFVFWISSSEPIDVATERVSLTVMNANLVIPDEHLGEVHLALDIPTEDAFDDWYSLVKEDGLRQGELRIGVRRMKLTSSAMLLAAQSMAASGRSLNDADLATHGATLPTLWYGFAEAAEPVEDRVSQTEILSAKLNDFSRRFMGIEIAPTDVTSDGKRRNIF